MLRGRGLADQENDLFQPIINRLGGDGTIGAIAGNKDHRAVWPIGLLHSM